MNNFQLEQKIKYLEEQLAIEISVKKSEVCLNSDFKDHIKKLEIHIVNLSNLNDELALKLAKSNNRLIKLLDEV
jgi:hypothetical protein